MRLQRSRARLGVGIIAFFAMLIVGALLWTLFDPALSSALDFGHGYSESSTVDHYLGIFDSVWSGILYFVVFLAGITVLGRAVRESRVR